MNDILKFDQLQTSLFYRASYLNSGGLEPCFGGAKLIKDLPWLRDCVAKLQFAFKCNWLEKYLGYTICQACKICQTFCLWAWQGPKWHNAFR